ncbi:MAG: hypothetical protein CSB46_01005 [Micrococcales bacterium]|nr:MAG: hypothetical protein CSB46_01005 [Micrococcales bacterium]
MIAGEVSKAAGFVYDKAATVRMRLTRADAAGPEYVFPPQTGVTLANGSGGFGAIGHPVCPDGSPNCVTVDAGERERTGLFPFTDRHLLHRAPRGEFPGGSQTGTVGHDRQRESRGAAVPGRRGSDRGARNGMVDHDPQRGLRR